MSDELGIASIVAVSGLDVAGQARGTAGRGGAAGSIVTIAGQAVRAAVRAWERPPAGADLFVVSLPVMPARQGGAPAQAQLDSAFNQALVREVALANGLTGALPVGVTGTSASGSALEAAALLMTHDQFSTAVVVAVDVTAATIHSAAWPRWACAGVVTRRPPWHVCLERAEMVPLDPGRPLELAVPEGLRLLAESLAGAGEPYLRNLRIVVLCHRPANVRQVDGCAARCRTAGAQVIVHDADAFGIRPGRSVLTTADLWSAAGTGERLLVLEVSGEAVHGFRLSRAH